MASRHSVVTVKLTPGIRKYIDEKMAEIKEKYLPQMRDGLKWQAMRLLDDHCRSVKRSCWDCRDKDETLRELCPKRVGKSKHNMTTKEARKLVSYFRKEGKL